MTYCEPSWSRCYRRAKILALISCNRRCPVNSVEKREELTPPARWRLDRFLQIVIDPSGMYDEAVVQRFQSERQFLAIMDHPAIAKVFDAGAHLQGQPYLIMEFVPGLSITEYCDQHKLKIRERLELFIHACEDVQHAH